MVRSVRAAWLAFLVALLAVPTRSIAQPALAAQGSATTKLEQAKDLFRQGVALLDVGDAERALDYFVRSRDLVPNSKNTANAAICLDRLGRYDEALELYEELVTKFDVDLDAEDKAIIGPAMAALREKVGGLTISANVTGAVVVDGRARGTLPTLSPIRLIGGSHVVRVLKDGYAPLEAKVDIANGKTTTLQAVLRPLSGQGILRIEDPNLPKAEVFVDGASVGEAPWEGTRAPGKHIVWTRKDDSGSAPSAIVVVEGQTALARVTSAALGPPLRIDIVPSTAQISVDGVPLGTGAWDGRLPVGRHSVVGSEAGYLEHSVALQVPAMPSAASKLVVRLDIDPNDPRWPKPSRGHLFLQALGGYAGGPTLHADAGDDCPLRCSGRPTVDGYIVGARGGYRFEPGVAVELAGGYMALRSSFTRSVADQYGNPPTRVTYDLHDTLRLSGAFAGLGASYRFGFGRLGFLTRTTIGLLIATSSDPVTGSATTTGSSLAINVQNRSESVSSFPVFVSPELGGDVALGPVRLGLGVAFDFFFGGSPRLSHSQIGLAKPDCPVTADPSTVGCAKNSARITNERAYGPFWLWSPQLQASYVF